jgi:L-fuculose-phosphate aldolase
MFQEKYKQEIEELVEACHRCAELNYVTSSGGNLSVRVDENTILITPTKTLKRKMRFEDICVIDLEGNVLYASEGKKPTGEWPFHTRIMRKRPDINAIVHTHPPILTGFAIANNGIMEKPFLPEPIIEVGPILTVPYETPLSEALSEQFDSVIEKSNGFLMENHGAVFCSSIGVEDAVELLNMSECMAESVLTAMILGNAKVIPRNYVKEMDNVIAIRNLKMPGAEGKYHSASELYNID